MALQAANIPDLVTATLRDLGRTKWTDLSGDLQEYTTVVMFMSRDRMKVFDSGYEFSWSLQIDDNGSARSTGLFATDVTNVRDTMTTGNHPFRHITCNYSFDLREPAFNSGEAAIFDLVKTRKIAAEISKFKFLERVFWRVPSSTSDDPHGIPYWIVKNNTTGFNGGAPSGHTTVGNVNPTTGANGRWKNYTAQYTNITASDLISKLDTAMDKCVFMPPVNIPQYASKTNWGIYTTQTARQSMKQLAMAQNDNLGFDLDPANGKVMFRRTGINWIPQLDEDTTNPFYGIPWGKMRLAVRKGWLMRPTRIEIAPGQHTVTQVHEDSTLNPFMYDRRGAFVLATDTTMPS